jgi:uncharacterized membrane protein
MAAFRWVGAAALGATVMYFMDPRAGRHRRVRARAELGHFVRTSWRGLRVGSYDLSQRLHGVVAAARGWQDEAPDDDVLAERVRARLGHVCSHPHAISVECRARRVRVAGAVLTGEASRIVAAVRDVPGVGEVEDHLERHATADVVSLQGKSRYAHVGRHGQPWRSATRLVVGGAGVVVAAASARRGGFLGLAGTLLGGATLLRSVTNAPLGAVIGVGTPRREIELQQTTTIHAPVAEVFAFFTAFENFPRFMRHVLEVSKLDGLRYHWKVQGLAGTTFEWDGIVTRLAPNAFVSWMSAESASVKHTGSARFEPVGEGATRVSIRMSYVPPFGFVGHELATLFGADPKRELEEDLLRLKSLLETGKTTGHLGAVGRDELASGAR